MLGDCHDQHGAEDMCVAGAIQNFTSQLLHYREGSADRRCKEIDQIFVFFLSSRLFLTAIDH